MFLLWHSNMTENAVHATLFMYVYAHLFLISNKHKLITIFYIYYISVVFLFNLIFFTHYFPSYIQ